jgi:hypothetical protein
MQPGSALNRLAEFKKKQPTLGRQNPFSSIYAGVDRWKRKEC